MTALRCYQKVNYSSKSTSFRGDRTWNFCPPTRNGKTRLQGALLVTTRSNGIAKKKKTQTCNAESSSLEKSTSNLLRRQQKSHSSQTLKTSACQNRHAKAFCYVIKFTILFVLVHHTQSLTHNHQIPNTLFKPQKSHWCSFTVTLVMKLYEQLCSDYL